MSFKGMTRGPASAKLPLMQLLLLLALGVRLIAMLMGSLRMLLSSGGVLLALGVIALAMMFRSGTVRLGCSLVMLSSLIVLVSCHDRVLVIRSQREPSQPLSPLFLGTEHHTEMFLSLRQEELAALPVIEPEQGSST